MHNLFCQSVDCENIALYGDESIGFWCRFCWERMNALLREKLEIPGGPELTPAQRAVWRVMTQQGRK